MAGLILFACLAFVAGIFFVTQVTLGVALFTAACFFGILARIAQAHEHSQATQQAAQPEPPHLQGVESREE
jgi:hypothetical protein